MTDNNQYIQIKKKDKSKFYLSKSFYGAMFFSVALWFYTIMNDEYQTVVQVPLTIQLPSNKAVQDKLPPVLNVVTKGTGWNLMNLLYFNSSKNCNVNLQTKDLSSTTYEVSRQEIIKSIEFFQNVETRDVFPDNIKVNYGTLFTKKVKVVPDVKIATIENFIFTDSIKVTPNEILIKGDKEILNKIDYIKTKHLVLKELNESVHSTIGLDNSLASVLSFSQDFVKLNINIQYKSHIILDNIDVYKYLNFPNILAVPENIKIIISGGVDDLKHLDLNSFYNTLKVKKVKENDYIYEFQSDLPKKYKVTFVPKYIKINEIVKYL